MSQLRKIDEPLAKSFSEYRKIIGFGNVLIHAYGIIDDAKTWDIVQHDLPVLTQEVARLLQP